MREPGSEALRNEIDRHDDNAKIISVITPIEIRSAIGKLSRMQLISDVVAKSAKSDMEEETSHFTPWRIEPVLNEAHRLVEHRSLRTLDALQLSCALDVGNFLPRTDKLLFIASDKRLLEAARAEGLACWNPETDPAP